MTQSHANPIQLDADLCCVKCNYNLNGLDPYTNCPECGTPIPASEHAAHPFRAHPQSTKALLRGLRLVFWGNLAITPSLCSLLAFALNSPPGKPAFAMALGGIAAALVISAVGWLLVVRDGLPNRVTAFGPISVLATNVVLVAVIILALVNTLVPGASSSPGLINELLGLVAAVFFVAALGTFVLGGMARLTLLEEINRLLGPRRLSTGIGSDVYLLAVIATFCFPVGFALYIVMIGRLMRAITTAAHTSGVHLD